jgi:large subunit ribosomal protein L13
LKTTLPKKSEIKRRWFLVDAAGKPAGRLAVRVAMVLRGKDKPTYTPHLDTGDHVIVINADKVRLTGSKEEQKIYKHYTGYPSGLREYPAKLIRQRDPTRIVAQAVRGMLPHNRLGREMYGKLQVYAGADHPRVAQQPVALELK